MMASFRRSEFDGPLSRRDLLKIAVAGSASLALSACGRAAPGAPASSSTSPAVSGGTSQPAWDKLVASARQERTLTIAGPAQEAERSVIMTFQQAYPDVKLQYTGLNALEFVQRADAERGAGQYLWDAFVGGASDQYAYIPKGMFQPLKPALVLPEVLDDGSWLGGVDGGFEDKQEKYVYAFVAYLTNLLKVNRTAVPESQLSSAEGLVDPKWSGKIVIYDPAAGGAGLLVLTALRKELGDEAIRKLLVDQKPVFSADKRQFTEWVVRARYPIGVGIADAYLEPFWQEGLGKDVQTLKTRLEILTGGSGNLVLMDRPPHPGAAALFVNWLLSKSTQATWAKVAVTNSRRLDVPAGSPDTKPDPARIADYINFNAELGNAYMRDTQAFAAKVLQQ